MEDQSTHVPVPHPDLEVPAGYELRRVMPRYLHPLTAKHRKTVDGVIKLVEYQYRRCSRQRCSEVIEVHRITTGHVNHQPTYAYYWPDNAILLERRTDSQTILRQHPFCSYHCVSLWSARESKERYER